MRDNGYPCRVSFGLSFEKLFVIAIIAVILLGPERLPYYASQLAKLVRGVRDLANGAKERMREEMGPDFDDVDWKKLDPRQYDPRRIIREALTDEPAPATRPGQAAGASVGGAAPVRESAYAQRQRLIREGRPAPFDLEAT